MLRTPKQWHKVWQERFPLLMAAFEGSDPFEATISLVSGRHYHGAPHMPICSSIPLEWPKGRDGTQISELPFEHITAITVDAE